MCLLGYALDVGTREISFITDASSHETITNWKGFVRDVFIGAIGPDEDGKIGGEGFTDLSYNSLYTPVIGILDVEFSFLNEQN
jgi:hypothetical protein